MTDENQQHAEGEIADQGHQPSDSESEVAVAHSPVFQPAKSAPGLIYIYPAIAVALGLLVGVGVAITAGGPAGRTGKYDLGPVKFDSAGLKGDLVLNWNKKLGYRLAVEPSDPMRNAEFSQVVSNPPRPLSVAIQLKDSGGYVLCIKTIVLKYDPRQAAAGTESARIVSASQPAQTDEMARLEAKEMERERGQDIFRNETGQDGQIQSISAEGEIPCSNEAYADTASWSFSPDFPSVGEQASLLQREKDDPANPDAAHAEAAAVRAAAAARRKAKRLAAEEPVRFALEGDDELVGFDPSRGIAKTSTRITFVVNAASAREAAAKWQDLPANIHYKCDMNGACTLSRRGAAVLNAHLRR